jgi:AcrR family transcriptional regulator
MTSPSPAERSARARNADERQAKRDAILDAALDIFVEQGFTPARLDDVAKRAGVAKGTLYLYFPSKQALFEALIRAGIAGPVEAMRARLTESDASTEVLLRMLFAFLSKELLGTRRKDILRLVITEAHRFPDIAEIYHREVIAKGIAALRHIGERAVARGEFHGDEIVRFPHLLIAPALVAVIWKSLFERLDPLDVDALFDAHLAVILRAMKGEQP